MYRILKKHFEKLLFILIGSAGGSWLFFEVLDYFFKAELEKTNKVRAPSGD